MVYGLRLGELVGYVPANAVDDYEVRPFRQWPRSRSLLSRCQMLSERSDTLFAVGYQLVLEKTSLAPVSGVGDKAGQVDPTAQSDPKGDRPGAPYFLKVYGLARPF